MSLSKRSLVVLVISAGFYLFTTFMDFPTQTIAAIGDSLVIHDVLVPVDVIHVIAGEDYRTLYAIKLYQQGYAKALFFTGGWCNQHGYFHGVHALDLALAAGIPRQAIAYDDSQVSSTYDEVVLLQKYLTDKQPTYRSIMVVSDPYHMRRSQWTYRHVLGKAFTSLMAPVPFEQTRFAPRWWSDKASSRYVMDEYQKMVYYFFRYQLNMHWLAVLDKY
jgi:uncharacterized SAM-binding protein YcdF (DUF218 family)